MALTTNLNVGANALLTTTSGLSKPVAPHSLAYGQTWVSGVLANQADKVWTGTRTLAASGTEDLDFAGTMLTDALGASVTFVRIKAIFVTADLANTNNVVIGGTAATQFVGPFGAATHTISIQPGGMFMVAAPGATAWPVAAGSTDLLKVANSAGSTGVTYSMMVVGTSA